MLRHVLIAIVPSLVSAATLHGQEVGWVEKLSRSDAGVAGNDDSIVPSISDDGRIVAFQSIATNLVPGVVPWYSHVYAIDRLTNHIFLVSANSSGVPGGSPGSLEAGVSGDGRYVTFSSASDNLVPGDTNNTWDVFVRDLQLGATERVSVGNNGQESNGLSDQGALSTDGRYVVFRTRATNFDPADTHTIEDIYVRDRLLSTTTLVSADSIGVWGGREASISSDGRYVAYTTVHAYDPADTNSRVDIYVRDMLTGTFTGASRTAAGTYGDNESRESKMSAGGTKIVFVGYSTNFVPGPDGTYAHIFLKDLTSGALRLLSETNAGVLADNESFEVAISADGQVAAFVSRAQNLAPLTPPFMRNVFVYDVATDHLSAGSVSSGGVLGNDRSEWPALSGDGQLVAYSSTSTNLVPEDTVGYRDVFVGVRMTTPAHRSFCYSGNSTFCPCSNQGLTGRGCRHSANNEGALLRAAGTPSVQADSIALEAFNLAPNTSALVFQGTQRVNNGLGATFGDGLRCAGGSVIRLVIRAAGPSGYLALGAGVPGDPLVSMIGAVPAGGGARMYQVWYRNAVAFCTPAFYNTTNGIEITWQP